MNEQTNNKQTNEQTIKIQTDKLHTDKLQTDKLTNKHTKAPKRAKQHVVKEINNSMMQ